jgi:hypothetical protein
LPACVVFVGGAQLPDVHRFSGRLLPQVVKDVGTVVTNAYPNDVVDVELSVAGVLSFFNDAVADKGGVARVLHFPVGSGAAAAVP